MARMGRTGVSPSQEFQIVLFGANGFYARTIAQLVRSYTGELFSVATIYRVLKRNGIRITDYRKGLGVEAAHMVTSCRAEYSAWHGQNRSKKQKTAEFAKMHNNRTRPSVASRVGNYIRLAESA